MGGRDEEKSGPKLTPRAHSRAPSQRRSLARAEAVGRGGERPHPSLPAWQCLPACVTARPPRLPSARGARPSRGSRRRAPSTVASGGGYGHNNTDVCRSQRPAGHSTGGGGTSGGGQQSPATPPTRERRGREGRGGGRRPGRRQVPARSACGDGGSIRRAQGGRCWQRGRRHEAGVHVQAGILEREGHRWGQTDLAVPPPAVVENERGGGRNSRNVEGGRSEEKLDEADGKCAWLSYE